MKTSKMITLVLVLSSLIPNIANAQVSFGTRHGLAVSTISKTGDIYDNADLSASYTGGLFVSIPLYSNLAIQPEINYIRKGRCNEKELNGTNLETCCKYDYLQLPVLARYSASLSPGSKTNLFFNAGPYAALMLKSENRLINGDELPSGLGVKDAKTPDFGLILGGGVEFPVRSFKVQFDLRYDMGLNKIDGQPDDFRTKSMSLGAGLIF
jgi:hypothetical protein